MLVLSRKISEQIVIDGQITITVIRIKGKQVSIGINAPPQVCIDRGEIHERRAAFDDTEAIADIELVLN